MEKEDLKIIDAYLLKLTTKSVFLDDLKERILSAAEKAIDKEMIAIFGDIKSSNEAMNRILDRGQKEKIQ